MADTFASTGLTITFYMHPDVQVTGNTLFADRYIRIPGSTWVVDLSGQITRRLICTAHVPALGRYQFRQLLGSYGTLTWPDGAWGVVATQASFSNYKANDLYTANLEFIVVST